MFADNVSSFSDTVARLQKQIDAIDTFSQKIGMKINIDKTKVVVFRRGGIIKSTEKWFLGGESIDVVPFYKYLGVYLTPKMSWSFTIDKLSLQAKKISSCVLMYSKKYGNLAPNDIFKIFDSMVKPILCYTSCIWGHTYNKKLESIHTDFCKRFCLLNSNCMDAFALSECGRLPLYTSYMTNCIKYWARLLRLEVSRYPKQCYNLLFQLDDIGRQTWATKIKDLLFRFGFGYVWIVQAVGDETLFIKTFKQRLIDCYSQNLYSEIVSSPKASYYQHYKTLLTVEQYLSLD